MAKYDSVIAARFEVIRIRGDERICRCPFHADGGNPNLQVNAVSGLYLCFSCGAKGTLGRSGGDKSSLQDLRDRLHRKIEREPVRIYPESWLNQFDGAHPFWKNRRLSDPVMRKFRLGYDAISDCVTIPVRSSRGEVMGVIRRRLDNLRPKYMHPKGFKSGQDLYGSWLVRQRHFSRAALVEGPLDAIACWDASVPALAMHGSRCTDDQAQILRSLGVTTVVVMTDNDRPGDEVVHQIKQAVPGLTVLVGWYRPGWNAKDPGELTPHRRREMFAHPLPYHKAFH